MPSLTPEGLVHSLDPTCPLCKAALAALTTHQETSGTEQPPSALQHSARAQFSFLNLQRQGHTHRDCTRPCTAPASPTRGIPQPQQTPNSCSNSVQPPLQSPRARNPTTNQREAPDGGLNTTKTLSSGCLGFGKSLLSFGPGVTWCSRLVSKSFLFFHHFSPHTGE